MTRKQVAAVGVLSHCLFGSAVARADCLDGQILLEEIFGQVVAVVSEEFSFNCSNGDFVETIGSFAANTDLGECLLEPTYTGYGAFATLVTDGLEATAVCRVEPIPGAEGGLSSYEAVAFADHDLRIEGGDMLVTWTITQQTVFEGEVATDGPTTLAVVLGPGLYENIFHVECHALASMFGGTATSTLSVSAVPAVVSRARVWETQGGGSYHEAGNWSTDCAPAYDAERQDNALWVDPTASYIPITGSGATANVWAVHNGSRVDFSGSAEVFSTLPTSPSLYIVTGGELRLSNHSSMKSVDTRIDAALPNVADSRMELIGDSSWTNSGRIQVGRGTLEVRSESDASTNQLQIGVVGTGGTGGGSGTVRVDDFGTFQVNQQFEIGVTQAGTLEVLEGSSFTLLDANAPTVLVGSGAPGTILVRGDDSSFDNYGVLRLAPAVVLGAGSTSVMRIERGGEAQVGRLDVGSLTLPGTAEVVVDGQGGRASLEVDAAISVEGTEIAEVLVKDGGAMVAVGLSIGSGGSSGGQLADVTIRGRGDAPLLLPSQLNIVDPAGGTLPVDVGFAGPGLLIIQAGSKADLAGGLRIGLSAGGTVVVTGLKAPKGTFSELGVTGETQVGVGTDGRLQLEHGARVVCNGPLRIGMAPGVAVDARVSVDGATSLLDVNGTLHVGAVGSGILDLKPGGIVECDILAVGPNNADGIGFLTLEVASFLAIHGNAQIATAPGSVGSIFLSEPGSALSIGGTMTIGNPAGGAGGGQVKLVDAEILGTGTIIVHPNGSLIGTGTVGVTKVDNGGTIAPGLSPGTLTIDGDYEQLAGGRLVMEFAGTSPGEFDVLHVTGDATLSGEVEVHFRDGFSPPDPRGFIESRSFVESERTVVGDFVVRSYAFPDAFADFDVDGDRDLLDAAALLNCFGVSGPECVVADWDDDGEVGAREVRELSARLTGPIAD